MLSSKISVKKLILALVGLAAAGAAIAAVVIALGLPTVSARPPHWAITTDLLHTVFKRAVATRADQEPPADLDSPGRIALGAQHYENVCSKCHGGPELGQSPVALSMRPRPQHLPAVVGQFSDAELYVILRNGVRFSAMPAWPSDRNLDEIWSVVAFLRQLPGMDGATYTRLVAGPDVEAPRMPYVAEGPLLESDTGIKAPPMDEYLYATPATEWADIAATGVPVERCAACHGVDGSGSPTEGRAPNLTVLSANYISDSLRAYASGRRHSGIMKVVASGLTGDQITALGRYYDGLPDKEGTRPETLQTALLETGKKIVEGGHPELAVAPCFVCHQTPRTEKGVFEIPALTGQNAPYLKQQLDAFAMSERGASGLYNPMPHEASGLSEEERTAVATYLASLPSGQIPAPPAREADLDNARGLVAQVCSECHGDAATGSSSGQTPNLTLQTSRYVHHQLEAFHTQTRKNDKMFQVTQRLDYDDMADLAAYFETLPPIPSPGDVDAGRAAAGAEIARNGLELAGVPACVTCHGRPGRDGLPLAPRLQGQNVGYLNSRLDYFARDSSLPLPGLNPMHRYAKAMTEDQRADVAAWFASQPPLPK
ncbi:hypothetical protein BOO69_01295 [Sulfitobacter alexandrii]|uniref:Cytochrome c domain-containing protein n=1 Tax=Sulfitobacter alexandrii TaxID=1917485 RepID=A0A1J0WD18_9RHOB|nr:c-type cytochrome [Sulfitobacter alexandrii]APE42195.1 hypothetical protein BOO69_01295 [Sulfitobacter alexandrii]